MNGVQESPTTKENRDFSHRAHGLRATYIVGCHCDPCRDANRTYHRAWALRRNGVRLVDLRRVRPLGEFLVREHGSIKAAARAAGVSYFALWRVLNDEGCSAASVASRIVQAVKDIEDGLRREAYREASRDAQRAYRGYKAATA